MMAGISPTTNAKTYELTLRRFGPDVRDAPATRIPYAGDGGHNMLASGPKSTPLPLNSHTRRQCMKYRSIPMSGLAHRLGRILLVAAMLVTILPQVTQAQEADGPLL